MRTVVTGGTGYIGGRLVTELVGRGASVAVVVIPGDPTPLPDGVACIEDPGTASGLADSLVGFKPDAVMHLAAAQDLTDTPAASDVLVAANLGFGARVLAAARFAGARALVAAGTYSAHADGDAGYAPQTLYAATKQAFGALAGHYRRNTELAAVVLELSDTYGPEDHRPKFLNLIAAAAASGKTLRASPGEQVIRPLHTDDIVAAFIHAASALVEGSELGGAYSVAGPDAVTLRELVAAFELATGRSVPVEWGAMPYRPGEIMAPWTGEALPGWAPRIGLAEGLAAVYGAGAGG
jgi:nucleoside-diphosphate-sugar epimerase